MDELVDELLAGQDAWYVGGALRDRLLGRDVFDIDVVCPEPERAARRYARRSGGSPFPLSERHGAWRVALDGGRTRDFTALQGGSLEADLGGRDFTVDAIAAPVGGGAEIDPFGGRGDLERGVLRAVSDSVFDDDPLRLLRAVRLEDELGLRLDAPTERLVRARAELAARPAGERILGELQRLAAAGWLRLDELGLLAELGGSAERLRAADLVDSPSFRLVAALGPALERLPISNELRAYARALRAPRRPRTARRARSTASGMRPSRGRSTRSRTCTRRARDAVRAAREQDPDEPLLRGDELGLPAGPAIGRMLELLAEERAAGAITTREEALELVRRRQEAVR